MTCPFCSSEKTRVIRTVKRTMSDGDIYVCRRRECTECQSRFNTFETYELSSPEAIFALRTVAACAAEQLGKVS